MTSDPTSSIPTLELVSNVDSATFRVLRALARVLEHAAALRSNGYSPDDAIRGALRALHATAALEGAARPVWAVVVQIENEWQEIQRRQREGGGHGTQAQ
jgi:hypothetical protein